MNKKPIEPGPPDGFSLIEVLLAAGMISFLLLGTAEILIQSIRIQNRTDEKLRISGVFAAETERIKSLPYSSEELAAGNHEIELIPAPGEMPVKVIWRVADEGPGLKRVNFILSRDGRMARPLEAVLLISRELGF